MEIWTIDYYFLTKEGEELHLTDTLEHFDGYHQRFLNYEQKYIDDCIAKHGRPPGLPAENNPIYKIRGNYIQFNSSRISEQTFELPIDKSLKGKILVSKGKPITLTTPEGRRYLVNHE